MQPETDITASEGRGLPAGTPFVLRGLKRYVAEPDSVKCLNDLKASASSTNPTPPSPPNDVT